MTDAFIINAIRKMTGRRLDLSRSRGAPQLDAHGARLLVEVLGKRERVELCLDGNRLRVDVAKILAASGRIEVLSLREAKVGRKALRALASSSGLRAVSLGESDVGHEGVVALLAGGHIEELSLDAAQCTRETYETLAASGTLRRLRLECHRVRGRAADERVLERGMKALLRSASILELHLYMVDVTREMLEVLAENRALRRLELLCGSVHSAALARALGSTRLSHLALEGVLLHQDDDGNEEGEEEDDDELPPPPRTLERAVMIAGEHEYPARMMTWLCRADLRELHLDAVHEEMPPELFDGLKHLRRVTFGDEDDFFRQLRLSPAARACLLLPSLEAVRAQDPDLETLGFLGQYCAGRLRRIVLDIDPRGLPLVVTRYIDAELPLEVTRIRRRQCPNETRPPPEDAVAWLARRRDRERQLEVAAARRMRTYCRRVFELLLGRVFGSYPAGIRSHIPHEILLPIARAIPAEGVEKSVREREAYVQFVYENVVEMQRAVKKGEGLPRVVQIGFQALGGEYFVPAEPIAFALRPRR